MRRRKQCTNHLLGAHHFLFAHRSNEKTITFNWRGSHNVYKMPSEVAMLSCDFSDAIEIAPTSNGGSVTVDVPAAGESRTTTPTRRQRAAATAKTASTSRSLVAVIMIR